MKQPPADVDGAPSHPWWKPDLGLVLLVGIVLVFLLLLTFEFWIPHPGGFER